MDLRELQKEAHEIAVSKGFWDKERNNSEMLMVSELGEACEGRNINLETEIIKKMGINKTRPILHGKQF